MENLLPKAIPLNEIPKSESITLLLYGPSGSGKTHFCGTAGSRSIIINIGRGIETLRSPSFTKRYSQANPRIVTISETRGSRGFTTIPKAFDDVCRSIDNLLEYESDSFDTISIDDCTSLRDYAMSKGMALSSDAKKASGFSASQKWGLALPTVSDYGTEMSLMEQFINAYTEIFKEAKKNLILVAHERISFNKPANIGEPPTIRKITPGFTGQTFPDRIPAYFDDVWHTQTKKSAQTIYELITEPDGITMAKTRQGGVLQKVEIDPNFLSLLSRLRA